MRRSLSAAIFLVFIAVFAANASAGEPVLTGEMEAQKIVMNEENREIAVPAEKVFPGDTVEYMLKYRNTGDVSASGVDLVGPVPSGTVYLDRTASDNKGLSPVFSIDGGKRYGQWPVIYEVIRKDGSSEQKVATPEMITHIKWAMGETLDIGQEVAVSYRVKVR